MLQDIHFCLAWLPNKGNHIVPISGVNSKDNIISHFQAINLSILNEDIDKFDGFPGLYSAKHRDM